MAIIRPKVLISYGRQNEPIRVPIFDLVVNSLTTYSTADNASGVSTITVKSITGFAINQILLIGDPNNQNSEIIKTHASTAPTGTTITFASNTVNPHSASTPIYLINFDQVEFSNATTLAGSKSVLSTVSLNAGMAETIYNDTTGSTGFYFARFKNTITTTFSSYSDGVPVAGYTPFMARSLINNALKGINKKISDVLSDEFLISEINNCLYEVKTELKRWSWLQLFDQSLGTMAQGTWRLALPTSLDDQNTEKSIFNLRLGTQPNLIYLDKQKWNNILQQVAHTTLKNNISVSDATITLTDSANFPSSGVVQIGVNSYTYTANVKATGVLTLSVVSTTTNTAGTDAFFGASQGNPTYWTTYGGYAYIYPIISSTFAGYELLMDYYSILTNVLLDTDLILIPDPNVVIYFLQWKALKALNNGEETDASKECRDEYRLRLARLKSKEVNGRNFKMKPRINNFALQESQNTDDISRAERDGAFPNTDF